MIVVGLILYLRVNSLLLIDYVASQVPHMKLTIYFPITQYYILDNFSIGITLRKSYRHTTALRKSNCRMVDSSLCNAIRLLIQYRELSCMNYICSKCWTSINAVSKFDMRNKLFVIFYYNLLEYFCKFLFLLRLWLCWLMFVFRQFFDALWEH